LGTDRNSDGYFLPVRIGMVGGGADAFIGAVHRHALRIDGACVLVCGALSSSAEKAKSSGRSLGLSEDRSYESWTEMFSREAVLPADMRMEAVSIVTPNHLHLPVAIAALNAGFHVISDKPATLDLEEARTLANAVEQSGKIYALTHTYLGYPMVREARRIIQQGTLGKIRKIYVEYTQGWLSDPLESENKQAEWRTDPKRSGLAGCMGDIGSHAHSLVEYVTGARMSDVRAWLQTIVEGRALDDDGAVFFKLDNNATGVLTASQICAGEENMLRIRVYGEKAGLDWNQEEPNTIMVKYGDGRQQRLRAGSNMPIGVEAQSFCRTPGGHPEGYLEAFSNLYTAFSGNVRSNAGSGGFMPGIQEAVRGMAFIEAVVASSNQDGEWKEVLNG